MSHWQAVQAVQRPRHTVSGLSRSIKAFIFNHVSQNNHKSVSHLPTSFPINFSHSHSILLMSSSNSHPSVSLSQFQGLFNAALNEYSQKTGKDITTHPLTARLQNCDSSDAVLGIFQEQAEVFNRYRNGDLMIQLMRRLKPTVDILFGLSTGGAFGEGIGLVGLISLT